MICLTFTDGVLGSGALLCSQQTEAGKNVQCCHVNTCKHPALIKLSHSLCVSVRCDGVTPFFRLSFCLVWAAGRVSCGFTVVSFQQFWKPNQSLDKWRLFFSRFKVWALNQFYWFCFYYLAPTGHFLSNNTKEWYNLKWISIYFYVTANTQMNMFLILCLRHEYFFKHN